MPDIEIPDHWDWKRLDELGEWNTGGTPRRSTEEYWEEGTIPWVTPKEMKRIRITSTEDNMTELGLKESTAKLVPEGTVLFVTRSGILEHSLPVAIAEADLTINQDMKTLSTDDGIVPEYILYFTQAFEQEILKNCTKDGTTVASIDSNSLYSLQIPVPSKSEQLEMIKRIEQLFTIIENGVDQLETASTQLDLYPKSVLKSVLEGEMPKNVNREPSKIHIDEDQSLENAPEIPGNWDLVRFEEILSEPLRNGHSAKASKTKNGIRTLTLGAVTNRNFSKENTKVTIADSEKVKDLWLEPSDILIERSNTPEYVGLSAIYQGEKDYAIFPDLMVRARVNRSKVLPKYAEYVLRASYARNYFRNNSKGTSGSMAKINQDHIRDFPFPLPPQSEQQEIVELLEKVYSSIDDTRKSINENLRRADNLKMSLLRDVYSGGLDTADSGQKIGNSSSKSPDAGMVQQKLDEIPEEK